MIKNSVAGLVILLAVTPLQAEIASPQPDLQVIQAAIASAHPLATEAGQTILQQGGNAFDAAITVSAVLAVVEPYSSGIGGGGFWLLHRARDQKQIMIDGREKAPIRAQPDMYLDAQGEIRANASLDGPLAAAIPGTIAALAHLAEHYGQLPLSKTLAPAIRLAREGFAVTAHYQKMAGFRKQALLASTESARLFLFDGDVPPLGHLIIQRDLGVTLQRVAEQGKAGFYQGKIASLLITGVQAAGGIWTQPDLDNYASVEREPLTGQYHNIRVISASPPSSGGAVLIQALNILERKDLSDQDPLSRKHLIVEAMKRAYQDRAVYMGDPDFVSFPKSILSKPYATLKAASIRTDRATSVTEPSSSVPPEGADTTHFSIIDSAGNRVAATLSINYPFGSGFVVPGTGVLLNDEMDDFSIRPKTPNAYGLIGSKANAIAPGKRPLSSMTPTFLETDDRIAILGTPGGSRIISMVLLAVLDFARGQGPESWVTLPRYHHQYQPDELQYEPGALTDQEQQSLVNLGHELKNTDRQYGNMQALMLDRKTGKVQAAADPRGEGRAEVRQ